MDTVGRHLLLELHGCDPVALDDLAVVERLLREAAEAAGATVVQALLHRFAPQGVSGVVVVEESHLSVHTWPEVGYAAVDFYTCGDCVPELAVDVMRAGLAAQRYEVMAIERGTTGGARTMNVQRHEVSSTPPCRRAV